MAHMTPFSKTREPLCTCRALRSPHVGSLTGAAGKRLMLQSAGGLPPTYLYC